MQREQLIECLKQLEDAVSDFLTQYANEQLKKIEILKEVLSKRGDNEHPKSQENSTELEEDS